MPAGNIQMTLKHLGVGVHVDTIIRILGNSSTIPRWWQSMPRPSSPRVWGTSEAATRSTRRSAARSRIWSLSWASPPGSSWRGTCRPPRKSTALPPLRKAWHMAGRVPERSSRTVSASTKSPSRRHPHAEGPQVHLHSATSTFGISYVTPTRSASTGGAGRFRYARGINKSCDIPHDNTPPPFHHAARWHSTQDTRRGRRHPHTRYGQVVAVIPERRICRVRRRERPTSWNSMNFCPRTHPF